MKVSAYVIKSLMTLFGKLPLSVHYVFADFIAFLVEHVYGYRRDDVAINLSRCFPEMDYGEIRRVRHQFYRHFADVIVEAIWFGASSPARLHKSRIVEIVNPEELARLHDVAPSVTVLQAHVGNWEIEGGIESYNYSDVDTHCNESNCCVIYKALSSPLWNDIMKMNRTAPLVDPEHYSGYLESREFLKFVASHRNNKMFYCINTDQRPYYTGSDSMEVTFMGLPCRTMSASAALAHKLHHAVVFKKMIVESRGHYKVEYVTICDDASTMTTEQIMNRFYELADEHLRQQPHNYLWTHHRWPHW